MSDNAEIPFEGIGVSPGIAFGRIHVVREDMDEVVRYQIAPSQVTDEIGRFEAGLIQTRMQILEMQQRIAESIGAKDAAIFDAHLLVVEDRTLIDEVLRKLKTDLCNVEWAFQEVATRYAETLSKIDDPYLRERALDIQDVTKRVIHNLQGKAPKAFLSLTQPHILVAHNLTPSDTATMNRENVLGIATDLGSRTSHAAILARSLNIPAVLGLHDITAKIETGQHVLVDGSDGWLIVNPTPETLEHYKQIESRRAKVAAQLNTVARDHLHHARWTSHCSFGKYRASGRRRCGCSQRRGGNRTLSHRVSLFEPRNPAKRGRAIRNLPKSCRARTSESADHSNF